MIRILVLGGVAFFCAGIASAQTSALSAQRAVLDQYCVTCHNRKLKTAGLQLDKMDLAHGGEEAEAWEKVVRKLRAGMMPPQGLPRPAPAAYEALTVALENELDRASAAKPKLAAPGVHRANRTEYADAIRNLLALDIDPAAYLPADDASYGFDNVASGLNVSPALVEGHVTGD
jgi:cytochrome c551/c552